MNGILGGEIKLIDEFTSLVVGIILIISFSFLLIYLSYSPIGKSFFSTSSTSDSSKKVNQTINGDKDNIRNNQKLPLYRI